MRLLVVVLLLISSGRSMGSCLSQSLKQNFSKYDEIFVGTVEAIRKSKNPAGNLIIVRVFKFEWIKGAGTEKVVLFVPYYVSERSLSSVAIEFKKDAKYLIYASRHKGQLHPSPCTTVSYSDRTKQDVEELQQLAKRD